MGKNLKGKEIGKGICQRKDGLYTARFVNKYGNRTTKCFKTVPEARNWLDEAKYADRHAEGKITILFLRKVTEPAVPFYTVEIDGDKKRQYHGFSNDRENGYKPLPEVKAFVEKWLEWVEKGSKRPKKKKNTTAA